MYNNITFKLMFFANADGKACWRVYTDSGMYHEVKTIDEIPKAVKSLLVDSARVTMEEIHNG